MFWQPFFDRWDEARAAEDDYAKLLGAPVLEANLAFAGTPPDVGWQRFQQLALAHCRSSVDFYAQPETAMSDVGFDGTLLTFPSSVQTETSANNLVQARVLGRGRRRVALVILPHWNAPAWSYQSFCGHLARLGFTAVELALPYHGPRSREGSSIADYFLSANLGRTIRSVRQAVVDTRAVVTWLAQQGYERVALIGISLGSCVAGLVAAHDQRIVSAALVLTAGDFAEVVWTGRATRHIYGAIKHTATLEQLHDIWSIISTETFASALARKGYRTLVLSGTRDSVVLPYLTQRFINQLNEHRAAYQWAQLGCGHYSLGLPPFNILAFSRLLLFFKASGLFR